MTDTQDRASLPPSAARNDAHQDLEPLWWERVQELLHDGHAPADVAALLGFDFDAEQNAVVAPGWRADDGQCPVDFPGATTAESAATAYALTGDWPEASITTWFRVRAWRQGVTVDLGRLSYVEISPAWHTIPIGPAEPRCESSSGHAWASPHALLGGLEQNPGVWGVNGGIEATEVCERCGTYRITCSNAQNPETGERGLRSTEYRDADDESRAWVQGVRR